MVWVLYGWTVWRRTPQIRQKYGAMERNKRVLLSIWLMIGGLLALLFGLFGAFSLLAPKNGAPGFALWLAVAAIGCVFVHAQTLSAAIMTTLMEREVTDAPSEASQNQESEGLEK